ncbi:bifunctional DNA primase/polymerase [Microbacterium sp. CFH 31415]|uniref:bifunctional DNA primase/polymerase n=1 Tax=Microbacterium sp. CFH 31415 TaxID=2921732 RepID=UPI001F141B75|nr:bifunctional DNA primase/polymerase [Microbacterium sp. CFH 31415]MCH6229337.1 bifunctional DNA primase/polymerase [Microbacterium sp. CFH 31415]
MEGNPPLRVLPLRPGTNIPAIKNWQNLASADHDQITQWRREVPGCNWGILTGDGLGVLDLDTKNAPEGDPGGFGSLIDIEELLAIDLSNLPMVTTANGVHLYFRYGGRLDSKVPWVPYLDVKADGGHQVAGPGTIRDDSSGVQRVYTLVRGSLREIPYAPDALLSAIRGWRVGRPGNGGGSTSPGGDLPTTEEAIEHGLPLNSRNDFMHRLACRWWLKLGFDAEAEVWTLARAVWDSTPGQGSFPWSEVETSVRSARRFIESEDYKTRQALTAWLYREGLA